MRNAKKLALIMLSGVILAMLAGCGAGKENSQDHSNMPNMDHSNMNTAAPQK